MPSTIFRFYSGVPLDMGYQNHVYATSPGGYSGALSTYLTQTASNQSYHRVGSPIEVNLSFAALSSCNYVAIQNPGERIYYGFVADVTYISPANTQVTYTIDVIGTYLNQGYVSLGSSWIERMHTAEDTIFSNLTPENFTPSVYRRSIIDNVVYDFSQNYTTIIVSGERPLNAETGSEPFPGTVYAGIYQGIGYIPDGTDGKTTSQALTQLTDANAADSVVEVFMYPSDMLPDSSTTEVPRTRSVTSTLSYQTVSGYVPANKKLFSYPYYYGEIYNCEGEKLMIQFELLENPNSMTCTLYGTVTPTASITCVVEGYNGQADFGETNTITMSSFPMCAFTIDSYRAWLAMNKNYLNQSSVLNTMDAVASIVQNPLGAANAIYHAAKSEYQLSTNILTASERSNAVKGQTTADAATSVKEKRFTFYLVQANLESARQIDDYWTRYGYPIRRVQLPSRNNRAKCTYLQTTGCNVSGSAPADAIEEIKQIHDRGITYWSSFANFFDYTNNTPLG